MSDSLKLSTPNGKDAVEDSKIFNALEQKENEKRIKQLQKNIADLEQLKADKDKAAAQAGGSNKIGARKNSNFKAVSTAPSINKTPRGSRTPPIPYSTTQDLSNSASATQTVRFNSDPAYVLNKTTQPSGKGDDPGTAKGVKSGTVNGEVKPTAASSMVRAEKKQIVRQGDANTMNGGNNPGIYTTTQEPSGGIANGNPTGDTDPPIKLQTPEEKGWFAKWWDKTKYEMGEAVAHPVEGIKGAAKGLANIPSNIGELLAKGSAYQQVADFEQSAMLQNAFGLGNAEQSAQIADQMREAADKIEVPKFKMSNAGQEGGDKILTGVTLLAGGAGIVKSGVKGVGALGKVAAGAEAVSGAEAAKGVAEGAKLLEGEKALAEGAKGADAAADAGKAAQAPSVAAPKPAGDGVKITWKKFRGKIRFRTAEDANAELIDMKRASKETPPFREGTTVSERQMAPGERFKMSMDDGQLSKLSNPNVPEGVGGWGTRDAFKNQSEALNKMAIDPKWKPNGIPNTVEFEVVKPFRVLDGVAGPQGSLSGGAQQFFLDLPRNGAKSFVRVVNVETLP